VQHDRVAAGVAAHAVVVEQAIVVDGAVST
jgi:hypothetical protein